MAAEAVHALREWRRAERLLAALPAEDPERAEVSAHLEAMRRLYHELTAESADSRARIATSDAQIARARATLERVALRCAAHESRPSGGDAAEA